MSSRAPVPSRTAASSSAAPDPTGDRSAVSRFVERIVAPNISAILQPTKGNSPAERSKTLEATAKRLATSLTLVNGMPGAAGMALVEQLGTLSHICTLLSDAQKQVVLADHGQGTLIHKDELGRLCGDLHCALSSLAELQGPPAADLPPAVIGHLDNLSTLVTHGLIVCLQVGVNHQYAQAEQSARDHESSTRRRHRTLGTGPTSDAVLDALKQTAPMRSRAVGLAKDCRDLSDLIREVVRPLKGETFTDSTVVALNKVYADHVVLRRDGATNTLSVHLSALDLVVKGFVASQDPAMGDLAAISKRAAALLGGLKRSRKDAAFRTPGFTEHVSQAFGHFIASQGHAIAVDARCSSSKLQDEAYCNFALQKEAIEALEGVAEGADAVSECVYSAKPETANRPSDDSLSAEEQQCLDNLIATYFKDLIDATEDVAPQPPAEPAGTSSGPSATARQPTLSLDWIEAAEAAATPPLPNASTRKKRNKGGLKGSQALQSASKASKAAALQRARERFELAANCDSTSAAAKSRAEWLITQARSEVERPGEFPKSAWQVGRYAEDAADTLVRGRSSISSALAALDAATRAVEEIDPDSATTRELVERRVTLNERAKGEIAALEKEERALRDEAPALQRAQVVNVFLAYPKLEGYRAISKDPNVSVTPLRVAQRSLLAETTVSGFRRPNPDYLDIYRLELRRRQDESAPWEDAGYVEFHAHFDGPDDTASPQAAHFKNAAQGPEGGQGVHRGRVEKYLIGPVLEELNG
jgi:hypothetical protein